MNNQGGPVVCALLSLVMMLILAMPTQAQLNIEITRGYDQPTRIAVVPFDRQQTVVLPEDVASIISNDLTLTGQFSALAPGRMLSFPAKHEDVFYRYWTLLNQEYLVIGQISAANAQQLRVSFQLFDVVAQRRLLSRTAVVTAQQLRDIAHSISDDIYQQITAVRGIASTKIAYVTYSTVQRQYRLQIADMDGHRVRTLFETREPILSPAWSKDLKQLAFVTFQNKHSQIRVIDLSSGRNQIVANHKNAINSAPAFSPDGRLLAFVSSRSGNSDIYQIDLQTQKIQQLTRHYAIDTEPAWSSDGKFLAFTSDRAGKPQIYQLALASGQVERLTFEGHYNARPQFSADGKYLIMVHGIDNRFHIAVQTRTTGELNILTQTSLDESPSIAPNGSMLVYATKQQGRGVLALVSVDGRVTSVLPDSSGDVREPAWSPYLNN